MNVSQASVADLKDILELNRKEYWSKIEDWKTCTMEERYDIAMWWADTKLLNWHWKTLQATGGGILIIKDEDRVVGELDYCLSLDTGGERAHIIWILVDQRYRRQGIATQLLTFLQRLIEVPIWVEAEDAASDSLYKRYGKVVEQLQTWILEPLARNKIQLQPRQTSWDQLLEAYAQSEIILGRYYAPAFDIRQLMNGEAVSTIIWGDMSSAPILLYEREEDWLYLVLTQYIRVFGHATPTYLEQVLKDSINRLVKLGFQYCQVQCYQEPATDAVLKNLHFYLQEQDPVYSLDVD